MNRRCNRVALGGLVLVAIQLGAWATYRWAQSAAEANAEIASERIEVALPHLELERPGADPSVAMAGELVVLHLWATWCAPCREELPRFMALGTGAATGPQFVAVSLDENWDVVEHYFNREPPAIVWRLRAPRQLPLEPTLPETWLVQDGRVVARARGAQTWTPRALQLWVAENTTTGLRQP